MSRVKILENRHPIFKAGKARQPISWVETVEKAASVPMAGRKIV